MKKQLLYDELIGEAWKKTKDKIWFWVGLLLILSIIPNIPSLFDHLVNKETPLATANIVFGIISVLSMILAIYLSIGEIRIFLNHDEGKKLTYTDLYKDYKLFWKFLSTIILYLLIVLGGMILFIVPGIIWAVRFQFAPWFVVDKKVGPVTALKMSANITNSNMWSLLGLNMIEKMISMIGMFALLIGLFWAYPVMMILQTRAYKILSAQAEKSE